MLQSFFHSKKTLPIVLSFALFVVQAVFMQLSKPDLMPSKQFMGFDLFPWFSGYEWLKFGLFVFAALWLGVVVLRIHYHHIQVKQQHFGVFLLHVICFPVWMKVFGMAYEWLAVLLIFSAFYRLLSMYQVEKNHALVYDSGVKIALAAILWPQSIVFLAFFILLWMVYSGPSPRLFGVALLGFLSPLAFLAVYLFWTDQLDFFFHCLWPNHWVLAWPYELSFSPTQWLVIGMLFLFAFLGLMHFFVGMRDWGIKQRKAVWLLIGMSLLALFVLPFRGQNMAAVFPLFWPFLLFFSMEFLGKKRKKWLAESLWLLFLVGHLALWIW